MSIIYAITESDCKEQVMRRLTHNQIKDVDITKFPKAGYPANVVKYIQRLLKEQIPHILIPQDMSLLVALSAVNIIPDYVTEEQEDLSACILKETRKSTTPLNRPRTSMPEIRPELTGGMVVYVDDIRDPRRFLPAEQCKDIWWIKHWWAAKNFLFAHEAEIEVLHLDHYLGNESGRLIEHIVDGHLTDTSEHPENTRGHSRDREHSGTDLFHMVRTRHRHDRAFKNLKYIYLHSNASDITCKLVAEYQDKLAEQGIALILNTQEW